MDTGEHGHVKTGVVLTCSLAWDTQVWMSSSSLDLWYFLVVFTATKMSFSSNLSCDLYSRGPPTPLSGILLTPFPVLGLLFLLISVLMGFPSPSELLLRPAVISLSPTCKKPAGTLTWCDVHTWAGLTWGRGLGSSTWCAGGRRAGMSRSRRPQNARENRKQNLLTPTEAMCILTGWWSRFISLQGCSHSQQHPVPSSDHSDESCIETGRFNSVWRGTFIPNPQFNDGAGDTAAQRHLQQHGSSWRSAKRQSYFKYTSYKHDQTAGMKTANLCQPHTWFITKVATL